MSRGALLNRRLKNLVMFCGLLILLISLTLVYRALTSKSSMNHHRSVSTANEKIWGLHPKHPVSYSDSILKEFRNDLMLADLIPRKSKNFRDINLITIAHKHVLLDFFISLHPENWGNVAESDDVALDLKYLLIDCDLESRMSCKQIDSLIINGYVQQSESKLVEHAQEETGQADGGIRRREFVIKSLIRANRTACAVQLRNADMCATMYDYRLLKEVFLLSTLRHPGIISMKGFCLRGNRVAASLREKGMIVVTEMGIPLSASVIEMSSWPQRVSMALQVAKLLLYLESTPLGSLQITKLTLSDFVLVRGTLVKLVDLDDLELGNKSCTKNSHCQLKDTNLGFQCVNKFCLGLNPAVNLHITAKKVLKPILQKPPGPAEVALVDRLDSFNISSRELVSELSKFFNHSPPAGPILFFESDESNTKGSHHSKEEKEGDKGKADTHSAVSQFIRYERKNFISLYDYPCAGTMAAWGCVFTVTSLAAGVKLCLTDDHCQAFVAFSSHPESENLMTIVLKNATDTKPAVYSGSTLFIKRRKEKMLEKDDNRVQQPEKQELSSESVPANVSFSKVQTCLDQVIQDQASSRKLWEKRLMNHLGHIGLREQTWKKVAITQDLKGPTDAIKTEGVGGKFAFSFANWPEETGVAKRIMFISEDGPRVYHKAYSIMYQLDRILGLYHTPPCVSMHLSADVVEYHRKNIVWDETFRSLITPAQTLSGLLVVPPRKSVKNKILSLEPLETMTSEIKSFDWSKKLQLEYVLLMWLVRIERFGDMLGYKDHFIHFNADTAFTNLGVDMSGYLNHCQFPRDIYEVLQCFRCDKQKNTNSNKVCFLGEEVIRRTHAMFPNEPDMFIQSLREDDLVMAMNSAAASALHIVDICINTFGRDHVLY